MNPTQTAGYRPDRHTSFSDPGPWGALLAAVEPSVQGVSAMVRNVIVHYREQGVGLPDRTREDIHGRWIIRTLERDQRRHGTPLNEHREISERVQGCCRDHVLLACAVLRHHGIAARGRVGFAHYLDPGFVHDHVVAEARLEGPAGRWVRFDPEVTAPRSDLDTPEDMPAGTTSPFLTAAEVWRGWRAGEIDADSYGAAPGHPARGPWMIQNYVVRDVAHRLGDELLLWDFWGGLARPGPLDHDVTTLTDRLAELVVAADAGDADAEAALERWYRTDPRLHPGHRVRRRDPRQPSAAPVVEELTPPGARRPGQPAGRRLLV